MDFLSKNPTCNFELVSKNTSNLIFESWRPSLENYGGTPRPNCQALRKNAKYETFSVSCYFWSLCDLVD